LRICDYGGLVTQRIVVKYGKKIYHNFDLEFKVNN
jgi:hypothetical protein